MEADGAAMIGGGDVEGRGALAGEDTETQKRPASFALGYIEDRTKIQVKNNWQSFLNVKYSKSGIFVMHYR